ncbi:MAG: serine hydrolase, partial [Saprospiraceae bacterium]|nr:serine hydrolase [Saprospiraceae bacterium]
MKLANKVLQLILILFILSSTSCNTKREYELNKDENYRHFTSNIQSIYGDSLLTGFGIGVIKNGKIAFLEGFGLANIKQEKSYTPHTIQNIGSVSKLIIGVAVVKAIEMGLFNLDSNINDLLPFEVSHRYLKD